MCKLILDESDAKTCAPSTPRFCNAMCKRRGAQLAFFDYTRNSAHVTFKHNAQRAEVTSTRCSLHATAYEKNLQQHLLRRLIFLLNGPGL